jgi:hypothetical protein
MRFKVSSTNSWIIFRTYKLAQDAHLYRLCERAALPVNARAQGRIAGTI